MDKIEVPNIKYIQAKLEQIHVCIDAYLEFLPMRDVINNQNMGNQNEKMSSRLFQKITKLFGIILRTELHNMDESTLSGNINTSVIGPFFEDDKEILLLVCISTRIEPRKDGSSIARRDWVVQEVVISFGSTPESRMNLILNKLGALREKSSIFNFCDGCPDSYLSGNLPANPIWKRASEQADYGLISTVRRTLDNKRGGTNRNRIIFAYEGILRWIIESSNDPERVRSRWRRTLLERIEPYMASTRRKQQKTN